MNSVIDGEVETNVGRVRVSTQVLFVLIGWAISGIIGYATAQNAMNARVAVLESQFQEMRMQLSDIRADVKTLLRR